MDKENVLLTDIHVLICHNATESEELNYIKNNFCGQVYSNIDDYCHCDSHRPNNTDASSILYLCGNNIDETEKQLCEYRSIYIIKELSDNYNNSKNLISLGEVPINIHNVGVYFRKLFNSDKDYFNSITNEHEFQSLTESNKPGTAYRKGIYLTKVEENKSETKFKLLRCSSNLDGPTDNFRNTDNEILDKVNSVSNEFFEQKTELNHVLAQIYYNDVLNGKEKKAKIGQHSDKTKDMPKNALIAFCTLYTDFKENTKQSGFDHCYKNTTVLTKLRFRLKKEVTDEKLEKLFDVTLYPNSVFFISLQTNRLYTHEIIPSGLPIDKIPTRMGYVIRCSNTNAVFKEDQTYIVFGKQYVKLVPQNKDGILKLKQLYLKENLTTEMVYYKNFDFSLNKGDYTKPIA